MSKGDVFERIEQLERHGRGQAKVIATLQRELAEAITLLRTVRESNVTTKWREMADAFLARNTD